MNPYLAEFIGTTILITETTYEKVRDHFSEEEKLDGLRGRLIDRKVVEMAMVFRASRPMIIRSVVLPQLVPFALAALRFGLALAWKTVVIAETFGATSGIGYKIIQARELLSMRGVLAWTLSFTLVMFFVEFGVLKLVEARLTAWRPRVVGLSLGATTT